MRFLYTVVFYFVLPFLYLRARFRKSIDGKHNQRFGERLGFYPDDALSASIWLHAVSYGEAVAAESLIIELKRQYQAIPFVITTMTMTGALRVQARWQKDSQIRHYYLPYDIPFAIKRFLRQVKPRVGIIMETELWPNLLHIAKASSIPLLLSNARLSPRSFEAYKRIKFFIAPFLKHLTMVAAQSKDDADRFIALGTPPSQVSVMGNLKFDVTPSQQQIIDGKAFRKQLSHQFVLVAASTHPKEEEQLIEVAMRLRQQLPHLLLLLVPRHPKRFNEVAELCVKKNVSLVRRSTGAFPTADTAIMLGDSMGELYYYYAMADVAFVGGSLIPVGGHNLLEPAALKLPIVTGPNLFNFTAISQLLIETGTLFVAKDSDTLYTILLSLFKNQAQRELAGAAGYAILAENKGAALKHVQFVREVITKIS